MLSFDSLLPLGSSDSATAVERYDVIDPVLRVADPREVVVQRDHMIMWVEVFSCADRIANRYVSALSSAFVGERDAAVLKPLHRSRVTGIGKWHSGSSKLCCGQ
jgi:hypothetical protein